jgi:hypothetical protein
MRPKKRSAQLDREIAAALGRRSSRHHAAIAEDADKERVIELLQAVDDRQVARDLLLQRGIIKTGRIKQLIPIGDSFTGRISMVEITGLGRPTPPSGHRFWVMTHSAPSFKVGDVIDFTTTREPTPTGIGTTLSARKTKLSGVGKLPKQRLHPVEILHSSTHFPESLVRRWVEKWWIE